MLLATERGMSNETSPLHERLGDPGGSEETSSAMPRKVTPDVQHPWLYSGMSGNLVKSHPQRSEGLPG